jgi:putative flippase GtrA
MMRNKWLTANPPAFCGRSELAGERWETARCDTGGHAPWWRAVRLGGSDTALISRRTLATVLERYRSVSFFGPPAIECAVEPAVRPVSSYSGSAWQALFFGATGRLLHQFCRYLVVGSLAFVIDFASLYLFTECAGLHYLLSAAIAFVLGLVTNYILSRLWVFDRRTIDNVAIEFFIFTITGIVGLGLNEVIIWFVREKIQLHYLLAKAVSAGIVLIWNFGARKSVLFH